MKKTLVLSVTPQKPDLQTIHAAAEFIVKGGLVAFPTETVYGLGADALNAKAVATLFKAKKRPLDNPPIVHVSDRKDVARLARKIPAEAEALMKKFWPGPLTLIFKRSTAVPDMTVAGLDTIAVRMPRHNVALALIKESGCPIAAPSANLAGKPSPTSARHVLEDLSGRIDAVLDAGPTKIGIESTVLDLTASPPQVLRPGGMPYEVLKHTVKTLRLNPVAVATQAVPVDVARSPGIKHRHYAPKADLVVVEGELQTVIDKVKELTDLHKRQGKKVGVLCTDETVEHYSVDLVKSLGSRKDLGSIARNLFAALREFDRDEVEIIVAEGMPTEGLGLAIVNRLRKASGYNIVKANSKLRNDSSTIHSRSRASKSLVLQAKPNSARARHLHNEKCNCGD